MIFRYPMKTFKSSQLLRHTRAEHSKPKYWRRHLEYTQKQYPTEVEVNYRLGQIGNKRNDDGIS